GGVRLALPTDELFTGVVEYAEITYGDRSQIFEVKVTSATPGMLRLKFQPPGIAQRRELVRILMGRADAWLSHKSPPRDRPLRSMFTVLKTALSLLQRHNRYVSEAPEAARVGAKIAGVALLIVAATASSIWPGTTFAQEQAPALPELPAPPAEVAGERLGLLNVPTRVDTLTLGKLGFASDPSIRGMRGELGVPFSVSQQDLVTDARVKL